MRNKIREVMQTYGYYLGRKRLRGFCGKIYTNIEIIIKPPHANS
jgi:hypothetical protein